MLSRERLQQQETPNVVDPGDMPPSRPARILSTATGGVQVPPNTAGLSGPNHKPMLASSGFRRSGSGAKKARTRAIPIQYQMDYDDEPNSVVSSQSSNDGSADGIMMEAGGRSAGDGLYRSDDPTVEQARVFAARLLTESNRRHSKTTTPTPSPHQKVRQMWDGLRHKKSLLPRVNLMDDDEEMSETKKKYTDSKNHDPDHDIHREFAPLQAEITESWMDDTSYAAQTQKKKRTHSLLAGGCLLVIILIVTLFFAFFVSHDEHPGELQPIRNDDDDNAGPSVDPQPVIPTTGNAAAAEDRLAFFQNFLVDQQISTRDDLTSPFSPQSLAATWMTTSDQEQLFLSLETDVPQETRRRWIQRYVLAVLYYATNGPKWIASLNWLGAAHECGWFDTVQESGTDEMIAVGVTCDDSLQVRNLLIPDNNLQGTLPDELRHLTKLDFLGVKHNELKGPIPAALQHLPLLSYVDLKYNQLTGTIPHFLGDLHRLQVLGLSKNQLTGTLPGSLGNLRLKTLALDGNHLDGSMSSISRLTTLEYLYMGGNALTGQLDRGLLADLNELIEADLSGNLIENGGPWIPSHLFSLPQLRVLDLASNSIEGSLPATLPDNSKLQYLSLRRNQMVGTIPTTISNLKALTHLDVEHNQLTGWIPGAVGALEELSYLFLGENNFQASTIPYQLQELIQLRELSLNDANLHDQLPAWLADMNNLKLLDLRNNQIDGKLSPVDFSTLPELTFLLLSGNEFTGAIPTSLSNLEELKVLTLHNNRLNGDAETVCMSNEDMKLLTTDCGDIASCPCCDECCREGDEECYKGTVWNTLKHSSPLWEEKFHRTDYSFDPHLLYDTPQEPKDYSQ